MQRHRIHLSSLPAVALGLCVVFAASVAAGGPRPLDDRERVVAPAPLLFGGTGTAAKSRVDTTFVLGGPGRWDGRFETPGGLPDWHGWTHRDLTEPDENHWQISTYFAGNLNGHGEGNHAMWCGEDFPPCDPEDPPGGVGDRYRDQLIWTQAVADPAQPVTVTLSAWLNTDLVDAGWDFLYYDVLTADGWERRETWTGTYDNLYFEDTVTLQPGDYAGPAGDEIRIRWLVETDWGWSDADCLSPSHGACQIDDITVLVDGDVASFDDFEPGSPVNWDPELLPGVGDFAKLWTGLGDLDPCRDNLGPQVAFIDDGEVVPGTGGTPCLTWCYGPGGWIVNNTGGLQDQTPQRFFLENYLVSPLLAWPDGHDGARLDFDVYRHETLCPSCPGVFYMWHVRSTASEDPADLENAAWRDRGLAFYGGPDYFRHQEPISDLLVPGARWGQVALEVNELGWVWGWNGADGTSAPYFDNVAVRAWIPDGPQIAVDERNLFQDAFSENGTVDPADPAANWCRVDIATDISGWGNPGPVDPGDSLVVDVVPLRAGATLTEHPRLHWVLRCNPFFDDVRTAPPGPYGLLRGSVAADSVRTAGGAVVADRWAFDLPDTGFFFPGDRLRYYVTAADDVAGDVRTAVWPPDTTGVTDFTAESQYTPLGEVRALPTLDAQGAPPAVLFWEHMRDDSRRDRWLRALGELGFQDGIDYDTYTARYPGLDRGQGLGARATVDQLDVYTTLVVASGTLIFDTITGPDDYSDDAALLGSWFDRGGKRVLASGDGLLTAAHYGGASAFYSRIGADLLDDDLVGALGLDRDLRLLPAADGEVLAPDAMWQLFLGCPDRARVDWIQPQGADAWSAATFAGADGQDLGESAIVAHVEATTGNRYLTVPFDLERVRGDQMGAPGGDPLIAPRAELLGQLLAWLGASGSGAPVSVPEIASLRVAAHPNPFNPRTVIAFDLPRPGPVDLAVYDLQGRLVRRLVSESRSAGRHEAVWNGRDTGGRAAASGVYFYRLAAGGEERLGKLTLLK